MLSNHFEGWLKSQGTFHLTAPRQEPNYNAVIERAAAVLASTTFAMLYHAKKPKGWCRRSNPKAIAPFEAYFGERPDLKDLRVFGWICYALVHPEDHKHLEPRAQCGVFVRVDGRIKLCLTLR